MKKLQVKLTGHTYNVLIGENIFSRLNRLMKNENLPVNIFAVIDKNVLKFHRAKLFAEFENPKGKFDFIIIDASEKIKSHSTLEKIYTRLLNKNFGRDTLILGIGGGLTGDIAGFAAATFMRGVKYAHIPTTLLAMVDSSIGGKTGINFGKTKNVVGAFYQPEFVLADTDFLNSLSQREILCGLGEIVKTAFLTDTKYYNYLQKNLAEAFKLEANVIKKLVSDSAQFKINIVEKDEKEAGLRKILNLGHTFAHAVEVDQNYKIKHGEAVIIGLVCALILSNRLGILADTKFETYKVFINNFVPFIKVKNYDTENMFKVMSGDKKKSENKIKFVLLEDIGNIFIDVEAEKKDILFSINEGLKLFTRKK